MDLKFYFKSLCFTVSNTGPVVLPGKEDKWQREKEPTRHDGHCTSLLRLHNSIILVRPGGFDYSREDKVKEIDMVWFWFWGKTNKDWKGKVIEKPPVNIKMSLKIGFPDLLKYHLTTLQFTAALSCKTTTQKGKIFAYHYPQR